VVGTAPYRGPQYLRPQIPAPGPAAEMTSQLSTLGGFTAGALAACGAVTVTNPMEVVKTRLQLQGELAARGQVRKVYTGVLQALRIIAVKEGIRGSAQGRGCGS
jgi:solute carrier family 25, member 34/35